CRAGSNPAAGRERAQSRHRARLRDCRPQGGCDAVSDRLPAALCLYRLISAAARPLAPLALRARLRRGKEPDKRLPERRGVASEARPAGVLIWVHAASVGELASVLPLIERIAERDVRVLVTTGTVTSSGLAEERLPSGVIHQFVPVDVPRYV